MIEIQVVNGSQQFHTLTHWNVSNMPIYDTTMTVNVFDYIWCKKTVYLLDLPNPLQKNFWNFWNTVLKFLIKKNYLLWEI